MIPEGAWGRWREREGLIRYVYAAPDFLYEYPDEDDEQTPRPIIQILDDHPLPEYKCSVCNPRRSWWKGQGVPEGDARGRSHP